MLDILLWIAGLIGLAILAVLVLAATKPNTFRWARSQRIEAPAARVELLEPARAGLELAQSP